MLSVGGLQLRRETGWRNPNWKKRMPLEGCDDDSTDEEDDIESF